MLVLTNQDPLRGKRIGIIGVSRNPEKYGYRVFKDLLDKGYSVYPVNPNNGTILGKPVFRNLNELIMAEGKPDMLIFIIPPAAAINTLREAVRQGITTFWFQPGSESRDIMTYCMQHKLACTFGMCIMHATDATPVRLGK